MRGRWIIVALLMMTQTLFSVLPGAWGEESEAAEPVITPVPRLWSYWSF